MWRCHALLPMLVVVAEQRQAAAARALGLCVYPFVHFDFDARWRPAAWKSPKQGLQRGGHEARASRVAGWPSTALGALCNQYRTVPCCHWHGRCAALPAPALPKLLAGGRPLLVILQPGRHAAAQAGGAHTYMPAPGNQQQPKASPYPYSAARYNQHDAPSSCTGIQGRLSHAHAMRRPCRVQGSACAPTPPSPTSGQTQGAAPARAHTAS